MSAVSLGLLGGWFKVSPVGSLPFSLRAPLKDLSGDVCGGLSWCGHLSMIRSLIFTSRVDNVMTVHWPT